MPYDWRTGQYTAGPPVDPNTFGPRQPQTVGVRGAAPHNPFAFMPGPNAPPPVWLPKSLGGTGGVATKPTTKKSGTTTPTDPWALLLKQISGSYETPAQMEARVNREINAQIAAQKKLLDDEYARQQASARASFEAQSLAGQAAAAMSKDLFGSVGGEFNAAAGEMKGLAHGLSKGTASVGNAEVGATNADLAAKGSPTIGAGGSIFAPGGNVQAGVEEYRGGTLPGQMFGTQGEAANFGLAGLLSSGNLAATQNAQAALMTATKDINDNHAKAIDALAAGRLDLYHTYMNDAKDAQIKTISLRQGILAAQQASATANKPLTRMVGKTLVQYDYGKGKWVPVVQAAKDPTKLTFKQLGTEIWAVDPTTGQPVRKVGNAKPNAPPNLVYKNVKMKDGKFHLVGLDPKTGQQVSDLGVSTTQGPKGAQPKTMTPGQVAAQAQKANQLASDLFYGYGKNAQGKRVAATQLGDFDPENPDTYGTGRVTYTKALQALLRNKVPEKVARQALNALYERGDQGRPFFSNAEKQVIYKRAGKAHYTGLLNTLNTYLQHGEYGNFDQLIAQTLRKYGLGG